MYLRGERELQGAQKAVAKVSMAETPGCPREGLRLCRKFMRFRLGERMKTAATLIPGAILSLFILAACGGGTPAAETPADSEATSGESNAETATPGPTPTAWSEGMTHEQQMAYMVEKIVPAMKPVFAQAPAFGCATCHGPEQTNAQDFQDPDKFLPRLTFKDGAITSFADQPEVSKFMLEKVVPAMAEAMGQKPYSPENPNGFGCSGCHGIDGL
jgi:cytochrome c553